MKLHSVVPNHEGPCRPVWLNRNYICNRMNRDVTGFFKLTKKYPWWPWTIRVGNEFHGIIDGRTVKSTANDVNYVKD